MIFYSLISRKIKIKLNIVKLQACICKIYRYNKSIWIIGRLSAEMYKFKKIIVSLIMVLIISYGIPAMFDMNVVMTAYAAEKAPALKEQKITLYLGYKDYTIKINNLAKGAKLSYKSSNEKVAKVSAKGVVKAISAGSATITATVKQNKKTFSLKLKVTVKKPYISITQSTSYLNAGETAQFKAKAYGIDGEISWSSSNPDVAEVSSKGKVTAKNGGQATIYARLGDLTAKCKLEIGTNRLGSFSTEISLYNDFTVWIRVTDIMEGESLQFQTGSSDIVSCEWAETFDGDRIALTIKPLKIGTDTITISSNKTNDKLFINVIVTEKPKQKKALTAEEIYELCGKSTVEINAVSDDMQSIGSGFYVDKGIIVTNYHVIEGAKKITVKGYDEETVEIKTILGFDKKLDLAILATDKENAPLIISQDKVAVGQDVYAIGSPFGLTATMTKGMVTSASRKISDNNVDYIQIDAPVSKGNSGGPLINKYGEVIGIINMYFVDGQNLNFAINIRELQKINTNRPISIEEYIELYDKMLLDEMLANAIIEDEQNSKKFATCQEIPSDTAVIGRLKPGELWDIYRFEMDYYGYFYAFINYKDGIGIDDSYFVLMDSEDSYLFAEKGDDYTAKLYDVFLIPGTYYIAILHKDDEYNGGDIDYIFYTARIYE